MRTLAYVKSLLGPNRWALTTGLAHPIKSIAFARGRNNSVRTLAAWKLAFSVTDARTRNYLTKRGELRAVRSLDRYLERQGKRWSRFDASLMSPFKGPFLYFLVRFTRPQTVVETGVASGISTSYILQALKENGRGRLVSVDLPNADPNVQIPGGQETGWVVPTKSRMFWILKLGNSCSLLPQILHEYGPVDIFLHDSLHTYDQMMWEYRTAWPALRPGGFLLSDDIIQNDAFSDFCNEVGAVGLARLELGIAKKAGSEM